jgi:hypothetical protein
MTDPFPQRPDHPDFWMLSRIVIDLDKRAEAPDMPFADMIAAVVDIRSVMYMASQRALRAAGPVVPTRFHHGKLQAAWVDGFMTGARYQAEKDRQS